jgi:hypothetical protein
MLVYSVALPLASMPAMKLIDLFGDNFRLALIVLWAILPFLIALILSLCYPERAKIGSIRITVLGAVIGFLLFAVNLLFYFPFVYSAPDAPVEVAAVVFTNHLFFALTVAMSYLIARQIFRSRWSALLVALTVAASSSYLFWGATAKDHSSTVAAFAVMLYFFVCYFRSPNFRDAACGFFLIGILAWIRPEVGFSALLCLGLFFIADHLLQIRQKQETLRSGLIHMSAILFTAIGSIPFFINNLIISGNPLVPVMELHDKILSGGTIVGIAPVSPVASTSHVVMTSNPLLVGGDFISTLGQYVFSISPNPLADLYGVLFFPKNDSMGFFFIVPIALLVVILSPLLVIKKIAWKNTFSRNKKIVVLLLVAAFSVFLAYIHLLNDMNTNPASTPDIRYLSPLYLPVILMCFILLEKTVLFIHPKVLVIRSFILGIILIPLITLALIILYPVWTASPSHYSVPFDFLILAEVILIAVLTVGYHLANRKADGISDLLLPILIVTVLTWQIIMIMIISPLIKFNGYPFFWIPGIDVLFHHFIMGTTP